MCVHALLQGEDDRLRSHSEEEELLTLHDISSDLSEVSVCVRVLISLLPRANRRTAGSRPYPCSSQYRVT